MNCHGRALHEYQVTDNPENVMARFMRAIHAFFPVIPAPVRNPEPPPLNAAPWMPGSSPGMTPKI